MDYLASVPQSGSLHPWLIVLAVGLVGVAVFAHIMTKRNGYASVRRRTRELRFICGGLAVVLILHLIFRGLGVDVLAWRLWLYLFGLYFLARLAWWGVGLRSVKHDKVDELNTHRKQLYFKKPRRKPAKRVKRRRK